MEKRTPAAKAESCSLLCGPAEAVPFQEKPSVGPQ
jgi:hypothetical protein